MTTLVILRFLGIFAVYTGVTLALPALMFRRILRGRSLAEQFLMCYTFGNFYIINIVFLLQLLHISNFFTLAGLTAVLSIVIGGRVNRIPLKQQAGNTWHLFGKLLRGRMKLKSAIFLFLGKCAAGIKRLAKFFYRHIVKNPIQSMLLLGIGVCLCWIYGRQIILVYGYRASDIPVHMSWINEMSRGKIFAKGVYPFGFHCMIYYLHAVFRFDTYVILCQFFFAQVIFMHLVLLAMLKQLCKTKYIPYIGTFVFLLGNFWSGQTYSRFYATLPQEFGMIFVIPSIYFLIRFFQIPKQKLADKETRLTLQCFAMAFSLTLAIHFYGTMIAGLCCIGIACGFCFRFLRKEYFRRIMFTGICSVFLAVLPMGIAFATGTPLQGSLGWGLSVINGGKSSSSTETEAETEEDIDGTGFKIGMVTDVGGVNDGSFNQSAWEGLQRAGEAFGCEVKYIESKGDADYVPNIESFLDEDYDLIVCVGYMMADAVRDAAELYPDQKFAIIDDASNADLDNVTCMMFEQEQASYLVGLAAGYTTESNIVGFVTGANETMNSFGYGYCAGVLDANPDATILQYNANNFGDASGGKTAVNTMVTKGADVVFHAAGGTGIGVIDGCKENKIWAIGVDSDQYAYYKESENPELADIILTSMLKNVGDSVVAFFEKVENGEAEWGKQNSLGLSDNAVGYVDNDFFEATVPEELRAVMTESKEKIASGELKAKSYYDFANEDEYQKLLDSVAP